MFFYSLANSFLGNILLVSDQKFLTGVYFLGQKNFPTINSNWLKTSDLEVFITTKAQLEEYLNGKRKIFNVKYQLQGTVLQKKVWAALTKIPAGKTISYKEVANIIKKPKAIRAVANAIANNKISLIIPCHRVIGSNGKLTGYAAGLHIKEKILAIEKQHYL